MRRSTSWTHASPTSEPEATPQNVGEPASAPGSPCGKERNLRDLAPFSWRQTTACFSCFDSARWGSFSAADLRAQNEDGEPLLVPRLFRYSVFCAVTTSAERRQQCAPQERCDYLPIVCVPGGVISPPVSMSLVILLSQRICKRLLPIYLSAVRRNS